MMGLKGTGKTTYLAALWHFLESAEIDDRIVVPTLQPDRDYLNSVRSNWLALKPVGRTSLRMRTTVSMNLEDKRSGSRIEVVVPDLSGESFRLQWETRKAPRSYEGFAKDCSGVFLFLHPSEFRRTHAIKPIPSGQAVFPDPESDGGIPVSESWTPEQSATQVQLVDLLQSLFALRGGAIGMRVAVIISAWDLVKVEITPMAWLASRLPLLSQFLRSNDDYFGSEVFGVSAQGGDLEKNKGELLDVDTPSSRCRAVRGDQLDYVSITAPLQFLLNLEGTDKVS